MAKFGRLLTAMVTPFDRDNNVDYRQAAEFARYLVANGSDGLVVAGSTGEAATMTIKERLQLFTAVLEAVGDKCPVIAGAGTNDTAATVELSKSVAALGVHGLLLVAPYYNKPSQEGLYRHFAAAAEAVSGTPIIVYNVPGRTNVNITAETTLRLAAIENIVAVKEASGNLEQMGEIIRNAPADFLFYSGDDGLLLPVLAIGGYGVISVASNIAGNQIQAMIAAYLAGDNAKAAACHLELLPLFKAMFITTNPTPVKAAVNLLGIAAGDVRLPLVPAQPKELAVIREEMLRLGLPVKY
jgi:4-hydroxy-tetrahydrodipicolinate synthase